MVGGSVSVTAIFVPARTYAKASHRQAWRMIRVLLALLPGTRLLDYFPDLVLVPSA